eukprot:334290-Pyramimonas_sp.AAC.1
MVVLWFSSPERDLPPSGGRPRGRALMPRKEMRKAQGAAHAAGCERLKTLPGSLALLQDAL